MTPKPWIFSVPPEHGHLMPAMYEGCNFQFQLGRQSLHYRCDAASLQAPRYQA